MQPLPTSQTNTAPTEDEIEALAEARGAFGSRPRHISDGVAKLQQLQNMQKTQE